jgi:hypothetical protein
MIAHEEGPGNLSVTLARPARHLSKGPASRPHAPRKGKAMLPRITRSNTIERAAPRDDPDATHEDDDAARPQVYIPSPGSPSNDLGTLSLRPWYIRPTRMGRASASPTEITRPRTDCSKKVGA